MKVGLLFPGYGSQFVGMGKELYDEYRVVQEYFEEAANCLDTNFVKLCFASSDAELSRIKNAYPATFLVSCSIAALLKDELGIQPDMVAGYNLGEYAAVCAAGGFSFPDGLYLLSKYASFYEEALQDMEVGVLNITGIPTQELGDMCMKASRGNERAQIAIYTTPTDHLVSGHLTALEQIRTFVIDRQGAIDEAGLEVGLHSDYMKPMVNNFQIYLEKVDFKDLPMPFISSIDALAISKGARIKQSIIAHIHSPLFWSGIMEKHFDDYDLLIEVGPGTMLSNMVKEKYPAKLSISINKKDDLEALEKLIEQHLTAAEKTDG